MKREIKIRHTGSEDLYTTISIADTTSLPGSENALMVTVEQPGQPKTEQQTAKLSELTPGEGVLLYQNQLIQYYAVASKTGLAIWLDGEVYHVEQYQKHHANHTSSSGHSTGTVLSGKKLIKAPMPGSILKVLVQPGELVSSGQNLLLMESMKMEITLSSDSEALVDTIYCQPGQQVALNDSLVKLSAPK